MSDVHPLAEYSVRSGKSLTAIAKEAGCSRMTLYRIMNGDNTTTDLLKRISAATGGEVPVGAFLPPDEAALEAPSALVDSAHAEAAE